MKFGNRPNYSFRTPYEQRICTKYMITLTMRRKLDSKICRHLIGGHQRLQAFTHPYSLVHYVPKEKKHTKKEKIRKHGHYKKGSRPLDVIYTEFVLMPRSKAKAYILTILD